MNSTLSDRVKLALAGPPKRTQVGLAKACGIKPPSVNDWVTGKTKTIEGANLLNAAAFLEVNPKWLAEGVGPMRLDQYPLVMEAPSFTYRVAADPVQVGLGLRLASARRGKGLSVEEVAETLNKTPAALTAWEAGREVPDALAIRIMAKLYDTSSDALLWEDSLSPEAMKFAAEFDNLTDKQQRTFRTVWMAFVADSASDGDVEEKMGATKEFKYRKVTETSPFDPTRKPEKVRKED